MRLIYTQALVQKTQTGSNMRLSRKHCRKSQFLAQCSSTIAYGQLKKYAGQVEWPAAGLFGLVMVFHRMDSPLKQTVSILISKYK